MLFDGETTFGWTIDGEAKATADSLHLGGGKLTVAKPACDLTDYELRFEYSHNGEGTILQDKRKVPLPVKSNEKDGSWYSMTVTMTEGGKRFHWQFGPPEEAGLRLSGTNESQDFMPRWKVPEEGSLRLRNVKLKPLAMKALFNGTDLTGWHVFPGKKSKFAVVDGAINVKDGPGDLQTDGKYGDFVLQLECLSNGKHLNSGIFFRCRPDEYQQGYEAQINNNFKDEPKEYTVEEYNPKTHELVGKKKVKSNAVDFGTGAIYRRVPARSQTAKDGEWFTMTVVAHGNHLATWVNGVQQVDWYDNRPANDNARNGCRLEAGHISIQGHDPTTDLSFRNIRIADLPAAK